MKFLDVKTDFAFKKVFGSADSKDLLISFLNSVIEFENKQIITDLTIVDSYNIPMLKGMKDTFVDVKAELGDGRRVIIEMQVLNPVIALTITDFILFDSSPELISHFKLLEKKQFIEYSDDIELIFIELPKFNKAEAELTTIQDKWLYFIKNAGDLDYIPHNLEQELEKAFSIANEANLSAEELELQHKKRDWVYIQKSSIELATKTGLKQGLEKGLEQGLEQGIEKGLEQGEWNAKVTMILNAHQLGLPMQTISELTGIDEDKILAVVQK